MASIPKFDCEPGCHACCGIVPFNKAECDAAVKVRPLEQWEPFGEGAWVPASALVTMSCPFVSGGCCTVYETRPMVCRLFGAVDHPMMTCPKGCGPKKKITDAKSREILRESA